MKRISYIIRSDWNEPYYFMSKEKNDKNAISIKFTPRLEDAHHFYKLSSAESIAELLKETSGDAFKIYPVCPICGEDYSDPPAISRQDNKSMICPRCGTGEALMAFITDLKKTKTTNQ